MKQQKILLMQVVFWFDLLRQELHKFTVTSCYAVSCAVWGDVEYFYNAEDNDLVNQDIPEYLIGVSENEAIESAVENANKLLEVAKAVAKAEYDMHIESITIAQEKYKKELISSLEEDAAKE
jgi:hypothetical protein